jgi:NADH-quinone oxidoreductase subunit N
VLASLAVLYAVFGLYYYMRIANAMLMRQPLEKDLLPLSWGMRAALGVTAVATVFIGIFPNWFIEAVNWSLGLTQTTPIAGLMK